MPKAKKITTNKKTKSDEKVVGEEKDTQQAEVGEVGEVADEEAEGGEGIVKVVDPDLIAGDDDVVSGFGIEGEEEESEEDEDGEIEEEAYDPFGDRFEQ